MTQAWDEIARSWRARLDLRGVKKKTTGWTDQWHLVCAGYTNAEAGSGAEWGGCGASLLVLCDGPEQVLVNPGQLIRLITGHLREHHGQIEPTVKLNAKRRAQ